MPLTDGGRCESARQARLDDRMGIALPRRQFRQPLADGVRRHADRPTDGLYSAPTVCLGLGRRPLSPQPFIHQRRQQTVLRFNLLCRSLIVHNP